MPGEPMKLGRRTLLQMIPASIVANAATGNAADHCGASKSEANAAEPYQLKFFTPEEAALFNSVAGLIIPADEHSPGAVEAKVVEFADLMIATGPDYVKEDWRAGLQLLGRELKSSDVHTWLDQVTQHEDDPQTVLEIFFRTLKQMTVNGYYTSSIGIHQDLQYQGNTYLTSFPGCDHPEHKA
jgi:gluconate 2-dehydrogenase gamma chain